MLSLTSFLGGVVSAQGIINLTPKVGLANKLSTITFSQIVGALIVLILVIAAVVFFFMLLIGGVRWIASGGDKAQTEAARNQITAAIIGLVIVFAAWAILQLIDLFFGIDIFTNGLQIIPVQNF